MARRGGGALSLGVVMLAYKILSLGFNHIPPVTLLLTLLQSGLFLGVLNPPWSSHDVCISAYHVLVMKDWRRILLSAFEHLDDMHLYYNMTSLLIKGRYLEKRFGSKKFLITMLILTISCGLCYVGLLEVAARHINPKYRSECALGFSGVLFAMKVLIAHYDCGGDYRDSYSASSFYYYTFTVPTRFAVWAELILIHIMVPRSSFAGHLAGILVGLAYISGPLAAPVSLIENILWVFGFGSTNGRGRRGRVNNGWFSSQPSYTYAHGTTTSDRQPDSREASYDDYEQPVYYAEGEENYESYSRDDYTAPSSYSTTRTRTALRQRAGREDIGWRVGGSSYTYTHGTAGQPSAPHLDDEDNSTLNDEDLRQRRLWRFQQGAH